MAFTKWYARYKEVFLEDAGQLSESARVRLLCEKLDGNSFEKYQRHVLPKEVTSIGFEETVETLKQVFDVRASEFTTRYQCLKLKCDSEDYLTYTGRVNEFCERAKIHELDCDGIKCLLWIFGLKSQREAEIRQRLIAVLNREYKAGRKLSLQELYRECENFLSLKKNSHKERFCEVANQGRTARSGSEGRRSRRNSDNNKNRVNRKTMQSSGKHVRGVKIANATVEVNSTRMYVEARVNQHPVSFLLDTGSDITLLNEDVWKSMGAPKLENTSVVVKNASGSSMKIRGKLWCEFEIKRPRSEGYAYVTPHNSLLGLEWIQKNEDMSCYMRMMVAEVKTDQNGDVAMKLMKSYPEVFEEGLGLCTKEKADLQLVGDVRPVFKACRPVPHAAVEAVEKELDRLLEMNVITPVTHSEWAAPIVCVRKSNGKLRMCADFSTGLNKALESFDYPLPVPEDIFATLNGGAYVNTTKFGQADGLSRLMRKHQVENEDIVIAAVENGECTLLKECTRRLPVTVADVELYTKSDPVLRKVISCVKSGKWPKTNQKLAHFHNHRETLSVVGGCLMSGERVVIPPELRAKVLKELHIGHPGIVRMKKLARSYVYWPNIDSDCEDMVRRCTNCQEAAENPTKVPLKTWPSPTRVWQRLHVDFAGPLEGVYYLVVVDALSKWPEMIEMSNISATKTVKALKSLFARFGLPQTIVSDNGTQFASEQFKTMYDEGGIVHIKTAPYHPQSNGQAERFVDTLKRGIKKLKGEERPSEETLNVVLQAYRMTPNSSLNEKTPAEVFLGRKLRTRMSLLVPQPESAEDPLVKERRERMEQQFERKHGVVKRKFDVGDKVYAKQWKSPQFHWAKGTVVRRVGSVNYEVEINGRIVRKYANQLRCRNKQEGHVEKNEGLKVLLEVLAAEDAYTGREEIVEPNPDRAIPNARLPATSDPTSTMPTTQGPPPPTLRRSTRIRRPVQRFDPSPA
ncbi:integrase core domain protein [Ancylostoma duodenale]|uniref:RNA-directed DNA polymerase n=1 Tax=Ancylostoma duodenale TaxID=51022 RepID=A0A0C2GSA2_9BILA|nr:integrase core domain protein [Ancylostoma duodenale]